MTSGKRPLLAFYGDDFTGSTDALESAVNAGARAVLFLEPPTRSQWSRFSGIQVVGVAGTTRSLGPRELTTVLQPALKALRAMGPRHLHYKVCSTCDSSPEVGSIGRAIDVGRSVCRTRPVPLLIGAPHLGRYCVFGNLFARMGIGSNGAIHRLDRHPSMAVHPITPADEADLRLHLGRQTKAKIGLFDILQLARPPRIRRAALGALRRQGCEAVLFDILYPAQLPALGALIDSLAPAGRPLFSVGSSSIEAALGSFWSRSGRFKEGAVPACGPVDRLLVVSGSCSPVTDRQIGHALAHGFGEVRVDAALLMKGATRLATTRRLAAEAIRVLKSGRSVIVHTCRGGEDPRLASGRRALRRGRLPLTRAARVLGAALGAIGKRAVEATGVRRVVVAGGDTASYAARALGIVSLEVAAAVAPGAPLCRARSAEPAIDGLELAFKGGQVGADDFFARAAGRR
jgi:uncharacterized protein YgbK (DUF1537 family)